METDRSRSQGRVRTSPIDSATKLWQISICRSHNPRDESNDSILKKITGLRLQWPEVLIKVTFHFITKVLSIDLTNNL